MNQRFQILAGGRKVIRKAVDEFGADRSISTVEYDDVTVVAFTVTGGDIEVECNRELQIQPGGTSAKIVG